MIYLDQAATSRHKPDAVIKAVVSAMENMGNAGRGAHGASLDASRMIFDTRQKLSDLFCAGNAERVAFTANSTESLNIAIQGLFEPGSHVITTAMEHNSVLRPLFLMEERGMELTIIPADALGNINYNDIEAAVRRNTRGIVCTHASNLTGNLVNLTKVGNICHNHRLLFVLDASQTAGVFPIDMEQMNIDVLCFTGHKSLLGPQGTGGICVREGVRFRPLIVGGSGIHTFSRSHPSKMPEALEAGTLNSHGIAGLSAALDFIRETGMEVIRKREYELMYRFWEKVREIQTVKIYGDFSQRVRAPIVALNIGDFDSGEVADELEQRFQISTRAGAHCAPLMHEALGTKKQGAVRFSMSYFNTEEEIDCAAAAVRLLAEEVTG